jgi:hypothetical protein
VINRSSIVLSFLVLVLGCAGHRAIPEWDESSPDGKLIHRPSGFTFPEELPGLKRSALHAFDESGSNASIGYSGTDFPLEITVFVYPAGLLPSGSPEDHLRAAVQDVFHFHPQARLERSGAMRLPLGATDVDGLSAFLTFVDQGRDCGSWVLIVPAGANIVKVRATYERGETGPEAGKRIRTSFNQVSAVLRAMKQEGSEAHGPNITLDRTGLSFAPLVSVAAPAAQRER